MNYALQPAQQRTARLQEETESKGAEGTELFKSGEGRHACILSLILTVGGLAALSSSLDLLSWMDYSGIVCLWLWWFIIETEMKLQHSPNRPSTCAPSASSSGAGRMTVIAFCNMCLGSLVNLNFFLIIFFFKYQFFPILFLLSCMSPPYLICPLHCLLSFTLLPLHI